MGGIILKGALPMTPARRRIRDAACVMVALLPYCLDADTLVFKNGQSVTSKSFFRQGDAIFAPPGPNGEQVTPETGVPLTAISKVECDPPGVFKSAPALLAVGTANNVLQEIEPALKVAETFGVLPGSHWPKLLVLQADIQIAMGKDREAYALATAMRKTRDVGLVSDSQALFALIAARKGDQGDADELISIVDKDSACPGTLAAVAVTRGLGHLKKQRYPEALKAFLELPVFLPDETALSGIARLGAAQAYFGMADYDRAITALESLIKTRPGTPEIATAQTFLPEWKRRRRVVEEAKDP